MSLTNQFNLYKRLIKNEQDKHGFIASDQCDSLLFTGLVGCTPGVYVDIRAAMAPDGSWQRRPTDAPPCYDCTDKWTLKTRLVSIYKYWKENGFDKVAMAKIFEKGGSSISRDMLVGLAWYCYFNKRLDISESVIKYALSHRLIMGDGTPTRTILTPGLLSTYAWISYKLGGPSRWLLRYIPQSESSKVVGFEAHLSVLHILLRNKLTGMNKYSNLLTAHAKREPRNALFQFAAGNTEAAEYLLSDTILWPANRLPTSDDRYEQWLFQRDDGDDWLPGGQFKQHSGADFIFCYWLINSYNEES